MHASVRVSCRDVGIMRQTESDWGDDRRGEGVRRAGGDHTTARLEGCDRGVFSPDGAEAFWSLMIPPRGSGHATGPARASSSGLDNTRVAGRSADPPTTYCLLPTVYFFFPAAPAISVASASAL